MPEMIDKPPREDIEDCKREGMTLQDISEIYNVSVSTVKRWIRSYGLATQKRTKKVIVMPTPKNTGQGSLLDQAKAKLGKRVSVHNIRGYFLDGRAVKADELIVAAGLTPRN